MDYGLLGKPKANKDPKGVSKTRKDAKKLQSMGTHGDVILAHINPQEATLLDVLADGKRDGGGTNKKTGLPSFGMSDGEGPSGNDSNAGGVGGGPAGGNTGGGLGGNTADGTGGLGGGYGGGNDGGYGVGGTNIGFDFNDPSLRGPESEISEARGFGGWGGYSMLNGYVDNNYGRAVGRTVSPLVNETYLGMPAQPKTYGAFKEAASPLGKIANFFNPVPGTKFGTVFDPVTAENHPAVAGSKSAAIADAVGIGLLGPGGGMLSRGIADNMGLLNDDWGTIAAFDNGIVSSPTTAAPSTEAPSTQAPTTDIASSSAAAISPGVGPGTGFFGGAPAPSSPDHTNGTDPFSFSMGMRAVAAMPGTTTATPKPVSSVEAFLQAHKLKSLSDPYFTGTGINTSPGVPQYLKSHYG